MDAPAEPHEALAEKAKRLVDSERLTLRLVMPAPSGGFGRGGGEGEGLAPEANLRTC
jgi:hypothetical protein